MRARRLLSASGLIKIWHLSSFNELRIEGDFQ